MTRARHVFRAALLFGAAGSAALVIPPTLLDLWNRETSPASTVDLYFSWVLLGFLLNAVPFFFAALVTVTVATLASPKAAEDLEAERVRFLIYGAAVLIGAGVSTAIRFLLLGDGPYEWFYSVVDVVILTLVVRSMIATRETTPHPPSTSAVRTNGADRR